MTYLENYKRRNPAAKLETRPLLFPDGKTRNITAAYWTWDTIQTLIDKHWLEDWPQITNLCWGIATSWNATQLKPCAISTTQVFEGELQLLTQRTLLDFQKFCADYGVENVLQKPIRNPNKPNLIAIEGRPKNAPVNYRDLCEG